MLEKLLLGILNIKYISKKIKFYFLYIITILCRFIINKKKIKNLPSKLYKINKKILTKLYVIYFT